MKHPVNANATYGTPREVHLVKILGALPSLAIPYRVRVAMYWSELAAEMVKIRIQLPGQYENRA